MVGDRKEVGRRWGRVDRWGEASSSNKQLMIYFETQWKALIEETVAHVVILILHCLCKKKKERK